MTGQPKGTKPAPRWRLLDRTVTDTKARNRGTKPKDIEAAIDEALVAVRAERAYRADQ